MTQILDDTAQKNHRPFVRAVPTFLYPVRGSSLHTSRRRRSTNQRFLVQVVFWFCFEPILFLDSNSFPAVRHRRHHHHQCDGPTVHRRALISEFANSKVYYSFSSFRLHLYSIHIYSRTRLVVVTVRRASSLTVSRWPAQVLRDTIIQLLLTTHGDDDDDGTTQSQTRFFFRAARLCVCFCFPYFYFNSLT